jgi:nucleotide sugar dehydrogenase
MKIGIVGLGVVGSAIQEGFKRLEHEVKVHDIKLDTSIKDILDTKIVFLCLPTNSKEDGSCNIDSIIDVLDTLSDINYQGLVAVKSTIVPGTYNKLTTFFDSNRLCLVPEFLREKYAVVDFIWNHNVLVIGTNNNDNIDIILEAHGHFPKEVKILTPQECEFVKYFSNSFKAYKTVFANSFGKLCDKFDVDYNKILEVYKAEEVKETAYLKYFKKGFGGMCLPKDVKAINKVTEDTNIDTFNFILEENKKFNED